MFRHSCKSTPYHTCHLTNTQKLKPVLPMCWVADRTCLAGPARQCRSLASSLNPGRFVALPTSAKCNEFGRVKSHQIKWNGCRLSHWQGHILLLVIAKRPMGSQFETGGSWCSGPMKIHFQSGLATKEILLSPVPELDISRDRRNPWPTGVVLTPQWSWAEQCHP